MGGGNAQKTAMARAKKQEQLAKAGGKGSQLKSNEAAKTLQCATCLQTFMCTMTEAKLKEHSDSKHPKLAFAQCFPNFGK